jgi:hypothetical protein
VADVSGSVRPFGAMRLPTYQPGEDETWDRLGDAWQAVDGALEDARLYVTWVTHGDGRSELAGVCVTGAPVTGEMLRAIPVGRLSQLPGATPFDPSELAPLRRRGDDAAGEFSNRVAYYYKIFAQITPHPAKAIAEHSNVPVGTVRGWIHEARVRGKLPPGTRGRAG